MGGCRRCRRRQWERAKSGRAAMAVDGGGGNGIFAAAVNNDNTIVVVAITSSVDGGGNDGRFCRQLRQRLMAAAPMAVLAVAALAVNGGGRDGGLCRRRLSSTEAEVGWSRRHRWGRL
jgi:hypothetical protein